MDKQKILIISISIAFFLFIELYIFDEYVEEQQIEIFNSYERGYDEGAIDAVTSIFTEIEDCKVASITLFDSTKEIVDHSCFIFEIPEPES